MFKLRDRRSNLLAVILVVAASLIVAGVVMDRDADKFTFQTAIGQTDEALEASPDFQQLAGANRAFIDLVARTRPAVVQITTKKELGAGPNGRLLPEEERFRDMFRDDLFRRFFDQAPRRERVPQREREPERVPRYTTGIGSGVIASDDGYILTNNHVIENADEITVTLADGRIYEAELIGSDPADSEAPNAGGSDLAVIKIDAEDLPVLPFGDSDALAVGEWVIAIGTPHNLSQTVTRGIVSAKDRDQFSDIPFSSFIQTDAPINRGNSGGALINIRGELVGINTLIYSGNIFGGNIGLGFAIPSNTARDNMIQLIEKGAVERGWLGIAMATVDRDLAEKLELEKPRGVLVRSVGPDSPAEKGGLERGDIITAIGGEEIRDMNHLRHLVGQGAVGEPIDIIVVRRGGEEKLLSVKLGERTQEARQALLEQPRESDSAESSAPKTFAGLRVRDLTKAVAERYGYGYDEKGVVITQVEAGSDAAKKGLQPGYLIQEMEWMPVENLDAYSKISDRISAENRKQVILYIKTPDRQGGEYVTIRVAPSE